MVCSLDFVLDGQHKTHIVRYIKPTDVLDLCHRFTRFVSDAVINRVAIGVGVLAAGIALVW